MQQHAEISDLELFEALVGTWTTESILPIYPSAGDPLGGGGERNGGCPDNPAR